MKMRAFQTIPEVVEAAQFERPDPPDRPVYPVEVAPCGCDAQDGHTCGRHRTPPEYAYGIRGRTRWHWIRPGEWFVRFANGDILTLPDPAFHTKFQKAGS